MIVSAFEIFKSEFLMSVRIPVDYFQLFCCC